MTRQQFARSYLMRLGIGRDLTRIALNPKYPRKLASEAELLALRPELQLIEQPRLLRSLDLLNRTPAGAWFWKAVPLPENTNKKWLGD